MQFAVHFVAGADGGGDGEEAEVPGGVVQAAWGVQCSGGVGKTRVAASNSFLLLLHLKSCDGQRRN